MATYEGTVDYFLRDFGSRVRDFSLSEAADGDRVSRSRAIEMINLAQKVIHRRLVTEVNSEVMTRSATCTQNSSDSAIWYLPARTVHIMTIRDSNTTHYRMIPTPLDPDQPGVYLQNRPNTIGKQLFFKDVTPSSSVIARVVEDPVLLSSGTNAATSDTSITLATTPGVGRDISDTNIFQGAEIRITGGNDAGDIQTINSSAGLVCQVTSWTTETPETTTDTYSLQCSLPREAWPAISAEAARLNMATDKEIIEFKPEIDAEAAETYQNAALALLRYTADMVKEPRRTIDWIR